MSQAAGFQGKAEAQKKKIEDLEAKIAKYEPRDPEAKRTEHEKENLERGLIQIEQEAKYFEIRAEQRRLYDKDSYMKAFKADLPWPPAEDFKVYEENKKLKTAPRDWDKTVPVDKSHNKHVEEKKPKKEEKKEE